MSGAREQFGSRIGFILAAAGSAVGIGNLVGFPVGAAKNGGGAFLLMYAIFVFAICLPVMLAEMSVGRHARKDPLGAYSDISGNEKKWKVAGWLAIATPFMIAVFYMVITVWLFGYLFEAISGNLDKLADPNTFGMFINSESIFAYMAVVVGVVYLILQGGVKEGIEKAAKQDNAMAGVTFYIVPEFSKITAEVVNGALSQAFFSLSLGMGILITYGSYIDKRADVPSAAKLVALTDTAVAFTAGLMILPAIFSFNPDINPDDLSESSVGMIFTYLPSIFLALQDSIGYIGASIVASLFFLLVFFAAITSLVSIFEVPVAALMDEKGVSRKWALGSLGSIMIILAILSALSFGKVEMLTSFMHYAGADKSLFDVIYDVFYDTILPLNGLLICLFVIYRWKSANFNASLEEGSQGYKGSWFEKYVDVSLKTFIPLILLVIFVNTVAVKYFGLSLFG